MFTREIYDIFKNNFFTEHLRWLLITFSKNCFKVLYKRNIDQLLSYSAPYKTFYKPKQLQKTKFLREYSIELLKSIGKTFSKQIL